jgi:Chromate resistance exported protein
MKSDRGRSEAARAPWLLLIHQLPPQPAYLRVKVWRRLQGMGAIAVKGAVYALPLNEQSQEDLRWLVREIVGSGGEASLCEARFVDGLSDQQVRALFDAARDADYDAIRNEAVALTDELGAQPERRGEDRRQLARLRRQLTQVAGIDFFGANRREAAEAALSTLEARLTEPDLETEREESMVSDDDLSGRRGRTWVTREGVHVDRIASAWLIRRFIDPEARSHSLSVRSVRRDPRRSGSTCTRPSLPMKATGAASRCSWLAPGWTSRRSRRSARSCTTSI